MQHIGLLNTAIRTTNQGDYIIVESVRKQFAPLLDKSFVIEFPTHSPIMRKGEFGFRSKRNSDYIAMSSLDFSLLCGTNLLSRDITLRWKQWNVKESDLRVLNNVVAVGVGSSSGFKSFSRRASRLYSSVFSSSYLHSARDERTKHLLESCGLRALNTGCVTMWTLTDKHCAGIPTDKADNVITTITDYNKDYANDSALLELLLSQYSKVYFWVQGIGDLEYIRELGFDDKVSLIAPNLDSYNAFLDSHQCDYVGTRLHAGIKAMQKKKRSIIIGIDNRSLDIAETYNINYVPRTDLDKLRLLINKSLTTRVGIDVEAINAFLLQFGVKFEA